MYYDSDEEEEETVQVRATREVRPDIYINPNDERELFITRKPADFNKTDSYEMVCDAPHVCIQYDKKKEYCPKYEVSWYIEKSATSEIITTFAPLLFTAMLACLNVLNAEDGQGANVENSIALCLTIVFVLPNLRVQGRTNQKRNLLGRWLLNNNAIVFFFFLGLAFTSVAHPQFFDEGAKIIEDHEGGSGSGEAPRDYIAFTNWYAGQQCAKCLPVFSRPPLRTDLGCPLLTPFSACLHGSKFLIPPLHARVHLWFACCRYKDYNVTGNVFGPAERFGMIGMICFAVALLIPVFNYAAYRAFKRGIVNSSTVKLGKHGEKVLTDDKKARKKDQEQFNKDRDADDDRVAFGKDSSFQMWELNDATGEKKAMAPDKLTALLKSMHTVRDVHQKTTAKSATATNQRQSVKSKAGDARSEVWKPKPKDEFHLECGPTHE